MNRPHISINFAISADGKITSVAHKASGWTSEEDSQRLKQLREGADAIMVGRGTLEADRMTMTASNSPLRCVVSRSGNFDFDHPLFHSAGGAIHLLSEKPLTVDLPDVTSHSGSLSDFVKTLHLVHGVAHLHCEGGGKLVRELAELDAVDEIHLTWAGHHLFGGKTAPGITGLPGDYLTDSRHYELLHFEPREDLGECFLSYRRLRD
ncbi:RibD family protein [Haloferula chungangensis]|uniref:RibD family protein n=1 Tax=Haloferula chungangensis TaxID=1048331 RepID=A0ABW2L824_9BACT